MMLNQVHLEGLTATYTLTPDDLKLLILALEVYEQRMGEVNQPDRAKMADYMGAAFDAALEVMQPAARGYDA